MDPVNRFRRDPDRQHLVSYTLPRQVVKPLLSLKEAVDHAAMRNCEIESYVLGKGQVVDPVNSLRRMPVAVRQKPKTRRNRPRCWPDTRVSATLSGRIEMEWLRVSVPGYSQRTPVSITPNSKWSLEHSHEKESQLWASSFSLGQPRPRSPESR